jgi:hypothetical protein
MIGFTVKWALAIGLASTITAGTATGAAAKAHKHHKHAIVGATASRNIVPNAAVQTNKICWRYYGGPKGGMWPGPCPYAM